MKGLLISLLAFIGVLTASAHPADISYLRAKVERQRLELRFTFNLLTLTRFVAVDANTDKRIDKTELDAAESALHRYLQSHIQTRINDQPASLGQPSALVCLWPSPDSPPQAVEEEWGQRHVDIVFVQDVEPVLQDVWLGFEIWPQTGPLGSIEAIYEQDQTRTQVPFSQGEPDYLYDTGYLTSDAPLAVDPFAQSPVSAPARPIWPLFGLALLAVGVCFWWLRRKAG